MRAAIRSLAVGLAITGLVGAGASAAQASSKPPKSVKKIDASKETEYTWKQWIKLTDNHRVYNHSLFIGDLIMK